MIIFKRELDLTLSSTYLLKYEIDEHQLQFWEALKTINKLVEKSMGNQLPN